VSGRIGRDRSDFNIVHEIGVSKSNEAMKMAFEWNVTNLFNNDSVLSFNPNPLAGPANSEYLRFNTTANASGTNFAAGMNGYDPIVLINAEAAGTSSFATGSQTLILNNRYGLPILTQGRRTMRLTLRFTF
jgi:hypothetical protein